MLIYNADTRTTENLVLLDDSGRDWLKDAAQADDAIEPISREQSRRFGTAARYQADNTSIRWWASLCEMQRLIVTYRRTAPADQLDTLDGIASDAWDMQRSLMLQVEMIEKWKNFSKIS